MKRLTIATAKPPAPAADPPPQTVDPDTSQHHQADDRPPVQAPDDDPDKPASMSARIHWAQLIKRVFKKDLEACPHCDGRRVLIAFITDAPVVQRILAHVGLPTEPPDIASARAPPQLDLGFDEDWTD